MDDLQKLADLGKRFQGVDLSFRRDGTDWPNRWRAECFSAKHEGVRKYAFGDSPSEAISRLMTIIIDSGY